MLTLIKVLRKDRKKSMKELITSKTESTFCPQLFKENNFVDNTFVSISLLFGVLNHLNLERWERFLGLVLSHGSGERMHPTQSRVRPRAPPKAI